MRLWEYLIMLSLIPILFFGLNFLQKLNDKEMIEEFGVSCVMFKGEVSCAGDYIECRLCDEPPIRQQVISLDIFNRNFCERWIENNYDVLAEQYNSNSSCAFAEGDLDD